MRKINLHDVPWEEWSSPSGKFHGRGRQLSIALGAVPNAILSKGGHPFDLEYGSIPSGKAPCPFHSHWTQWELFVVMAGQANVRHGSQSTKVHAGDAFMHPPGEAHQIFSGEDADLEYLLVANNPEVDIFHYPASNKWGFRPNGGIFQRNDVEYYRGEDDVPPGQVVNHPAEIAPGDGSFARFCTISELPEAEHQSPSGKYHSHTRDISIALGGIKDTGPWGGGHPFDLQERRVPPGASVCPRHAHGTQWEVFFVLAGTGTVRSGEERHEVGANDVFVQPPGTAHQITNTGSGDLRFFVVADNVPSESVHYPDSGKWMIKPQRKIFRMVETDYFDGEE